MNLNKKRIGPFTVKVEGAENKNLWYYSKIGREFSNAYLATHPCDESITGFTIRNFFIPTSACEVIKKPNFVNLNPPAPRKVKKKSEKIRLISHNLEDDTTQNFPSVQSAALYYKIPRSTLCEWINKGILVKKKFFLEVVSQCH